jgi:hypothetical protein
MKYSVVIYTTAANLSASDQLADALGYGLGNFSVPLGDTETSPVTHYGLHTYATQIFVDMLTAAGAGTPPTVGGMTAEEALAIVSQWGVSVRPVGVDSAEHFDSAVAPLTRDVLE